LSTKDIRLQYSGFVIFAAKIVSVVTGLIFQFTVARALSKTEYDLWFNINDVTAYFVLLAGVLPFWTMRYVTRDKEGAIKTGFFANLAISGVATLIYLLTIPTVMSALHISTAYLVTYLFVSIQILELYSLGVLESCLQARIPQAVGYGLLVQQFCKVVLGYVLIVQLGQLLLGAVVTTIVAFALQTSYYLKLLAQEMRKRIKIEYISEWLKGSIVNIYNVIGNQIAAYAVIMLFAYGGEGARGILGAAATVVNVVTYSSFLSYALYPKLLAEKKSEHVTSSLRMVLMFAIPMTTGAIALADSYMVLLRTEIAGAGPVLVVLALDAFIAVISGIYNAVLFGFETVDEEPKLSLRRLAKSRMFVAFSLPYVHSCITLPTAFYVLTNYAQNQPFEAALYVSIINSSARFAMFLVLYIIVRQIMKVSIPWRSIAKYVFASTVMGVILYVIPHPTRITLIVAETAVGGLIYIALLMAIDKEARRLPRDIIQEFRHK